MKGASNGALRLSLIYALHKTGLYGVLDGCRDYAKLATMAKRQSFSQFGEDLFLRSYFGDRQGLYIDIGGNHPFRLSNTYLLYRMGWKGLVVEPIRKLYVKHRRLRPRDIQINAAVSDRTGDLTFYQMIPPVLSTCDPKEVEKMLSSGSALLLHKYSVPTTTVAELYRTHLAPRPISLLSIDTEGYDMAVLRGVDWEEMNPEIVICEANDKGLREETYHFLAGHGYKCLKVLGCNLIFTNVRHAQ
jgi:FkbM family methyltransferase